MASRGKVLVAMSGGVDSSVAALLLRDQGYEVVGITMKTWDYESSGSSHRETGCCSLDAIHDARSVAVRFGFPHYVLDLREDFEKKIVSNFVDEYLAGRTPNPCVLCNRHIKWDDLLLKADQLDCDYIATGHYAERREENGRYFLRRGRDPEKDQTYVLWALSQQNLQRTLLPLAPYTKPEVKKMAEEYGLTDIARKSESFDICFIPDNDYRSFLDRRVKGLREKLQGGNFVDTKGKVLGRHQGYPFYTIGQRKGLEVAVGHPLYVNQIIPETNTVVLGVREELDRLEFAVSEINAMKYTSLVGLKNVITLIRYHDKGQAADLHDDPKGLKVVFHKSVQGVAPGQSAVFYEGDELLGGGIILANT